MNLHYKSGYKYQLDQDFIIQLTHLRPLGAIVTKYIRLDCDGLLAVRAGYAWDGCSGPTWDDKTNHVASLAHDALYQLIRMEMLEHKEWKASDQEFDIIAAQYKMNKLRRWYYQKGLRLANGSAADPKNKKKVHVIKLPNP